MYSYLHIIFIYLRRAGLASTTGNNSPDDKVPTSQWRFVVVSYNSVNHNLSFIVYVGEHENTVYRALTLTAGFNRDRVSIGCVAGVSNFDEIDLACLSWHASALSEEETWTLKHLCDQGFCSIPTYLSCSFRLSCSLTHSHCTRLFRRRNQCAIYLC